MTDKMLLRFWGIRGSLAVPGKKTSRYGGNTNCVTVNIGKELLIFDAGTGIKELSNHLLKENQFPLSAKVFITHPHYDHINGIPFFVPFYMEGNQFEIYGTQHNGYSIETLISGQMDNVYFPVTTKEFHGKITFKNLDEETVDMGNYELSTILLNHPGRCIGYRVKHDNKTFCYVTDNELYPLNDPLYRQEDVDRLIEFIRDSAFVVMDTTYDKDCEYEKKHNWGHSCISRAVDIANSARVKTLCLFHHDPDQYDKDIDAKLRHAKSLLKKLGSKTKCVAAREGDKFQL
jgi:phosphoribosyl 1,2-cyclic phosphodiesterase